MKNLVVRTALRVLVVVAMTAGIWYFGVQTIGEATEVDGRGYLVLWMFSLLVGIAGSQLCLSLLLHRRRVRESLLEYLSSAIVSGAVLDVVISRNETNELIVIAVILGVPAALVGLTARTLLDKVGERFSDQQGQVPHSGADSC